MNTRQTAAVSVLIVFACASVARAQQAPADPASPVLVETSASAPPAPPDERHAIGEPMWIAGLSVLVASWALTGAVTTTLVKISNSRDMTIAQSWIPIAGPWIMLADSSGFDTSQLALTFVSGILQTLGCAAFIAGLVLDGEASHGTTAARLRLVPTAGAEGAGVSVAGWF